MTITGSRTTSWRLDAITPGGEQVCRLALHRGSGSHDWALDAEVPLSWRADIDPTVLTHDGRPTAERLPDLRGLWARVTHRINGVPHVVATGPITGAPRHLAVAETVRLMAMDPTRLLQRAGLRSRLTLPSGTPIAETVLDMIGTYAPSVRATVVDVDATLRDPLSYDPGAPVLPVVNALLAAAGHTALAPRPDGTLWSAPWTPPEQRPIAIVFDRDTEAPYIPDLELDDDAFARPDEVIARTRGSQDAEPVVGRWPDWAPPDAVTETIDVEAADTQTATLLARQHWTQRQMVTRETEVDGPWQPIAPGDVAQFRLAVHGLDMTTEVQGVSTSWDLRGSTRYRLRGVAA